MALSEISLKEIDSSIDFITELHRKFDDDWNNMYKPLTLENTLLSETLTDDIRATLDELDAKTSKNEKKINALNDALEWQSL